MRYFPAHVPYGRVFRLWDQSVAARRYRSILAREWQPYLDGRRTFADAISRIVRALPPQTTARSASTGSR